MNCEHREYIINNYGAEECIMCGLLKTTVQQNFLYIDPIQQILMDFHAYCVMPNPDGKTELIKYDEWADKVKEVFKTDCACQEPWQRNVIHSKYECTGEKYGVLRAGIAENAKEETEKEYDFPQKPDIEVIKEFQDMIKTQARTEYATAIKEIIEKKWRDDPKFSDWHDFVLTLLEYHTK